MKEKIFIIGFAIIITLLAVSFVINNNTITPTYASIEYSNLLDSDTLTANSTTLLDSRVIDNYGNWKADTTSLDTNGVGDGTIGLIDTFVFGGSTSLITTKNVNYFYLTGQIKIFAEDTIEIAFPGQPFVPIFAGRTGIEFNPAFVDTLFVKAFRVENVFKVYILYTLLRTF